MSFEIESVAFISDSKSEKAKIANAQKMAIAHIKKALSATAQKFNKLHKVGSYFLDKDGDLCKTLSKAIGEMARQSVAVSVEYIENGGMWGEVSTLELTQPKSIKLLGEWLNEPSDISTDLNEAEFENLRSVCENMGLNLSGGHFLSGYDADDQYIIIEKGRETFEAKNIDFVEFLENIKDDSFEEFNEDDCAHLKNGNCRD